MRKLLGIVAAVALSVGLLPMVAMADRPENPGQEVVCAIGDGQFKYDVEEGQWTPSDPGIDLTIVLDDDSEADAITVPEGWVIVCAKGGTELVYPNASTVDMAKAVSHVVIDMITIPLPEICPPGTDHAGEIKGAAPCDDEEPRVPPSEETTTTTQPEITTTTVVDTPTTTTGQTTTSAPETTRDTLPFTGPKEVLRALGILALALLGVGSLIVASTKK